MAAGSAAFLNSGFDLDTELETDIIVPRPTPINIVAIIIPTLKKKITFY